MKVQLEKTFELPGSAQAAWIVLRDVERVAACMPGARITERIDDRHYKGAIVVKFGPASMSFRGEVSVAMLEPGSRTLRLAGKGTDTTGSSGASMELLARIDPVDTTASHLFGRSEVVVSGKAAAFGARMMSSVADQVLKQFGENFAGQVQAAQAQLPPVPAAATEAAAPAPPYVQEPLPTPARGELNAIALAWNVFKDWLRSLFTVKRA